MESEELGVNRLETFVDAILAIAMTILVLDLRVPELAGELVHSELAPKLMEMVPNIIAYIISFVMLGVYWIGHYNVAKAVKRVDRTLLWLNIGYLAVVVLVPFSTALLSRYGTEQVAHIVYGANLMLIGAFAYLQWDHATSKGLVASSTPTILIKSVKERIIAIPAICTFAIIISYFNTTLSLLVYMIIPIYAILPNPVDEYWTKIDK
ncbi:DUF1211 domain-containing protein [Candidatus Micrarchaeota archaeon]|nr:DUF1211 domain-containing protein [Candidatus Micrarchaeota archaeon]